MEWYHAFILGLVEGITEFLPVSSTGHLIIASSLMGVGEDERARAVNAFLVILQGFTLFAIVGLYWPRMKQMLLGLVGRDLAGRKLLINVLIAFTPIFILGPLLHSRIMEWLFKPGPVLAALALGGVWMIWLDRRRTAQGQSPAAAGIEIDHMTWKHALAIGLFQCLSLWPGTSRAMMTIAGGVVVGLKPARAAEFSFLLGLPAIGGAVVYQLYSDYRRDGHFYLITELGWLPIAVAIVVTVISAALTVKWLIAFLNSRGLAAFGWYRLALCVVLGILLWQGWVTLR